MTIPNPLRMLGLARIAAGGWFLFSATKTLMQFDLLKSQAARLFNGDVSATDIPIRSLLMLGLAPVLIALGAWLVFSGLRWSRPLRLTQGRPAALDREEVIATLVRHEPPAFGAGRQTPYWPLRRWLPEQLADLPWWQRDAMGIGVKALVRSCVFVLFLVALFTARPWVRGDDVLGPFPTSFVVVLLFATATWAALGLLLIPSSGPRIEPFAFQLSGVDHEQASREIERRLLGATRIDAAPGMIVLETAPTMLPRDPPAIGLSIGVLGVAVQVLVPTCWTLSFIGYPLMATSILRHAATIAGGLVFFVLGHRMLASAAALLSTFRYESTLVVLQDIGATVDGHAAAVRTVSRGLLAPRHILAAVADSNVREIPTLAHAPLQRDHLA